MGLRNGPLVTQFLDYRYNGFYCPLLHKRLLHNFGREFAIHMRKFEFSTIRNFHVTISIIALESCFGLKK